MPGSLLTLRAVRVFTQDFDRAYEFYWEVLGLEVLMRNRDAGFALFDTGATRLILESIDPRDPLERSLAGRFAGLSLGVPHLDKTYEALRDRGVTFLAPPSPQPWGGRMAHFRDPDGNILTLVE